MADVFISYSRRDTDFVRRLHAALQKADREAWVDWEDIPPIADWLAEVYGAIEAADTFVFVISPDSIASKVCLAELGHAAENHKRLIPLVRRDVNPDDVPESLRALNWIFLRDQDAFGAAFAKLLAALDTDLAWVKTHTRLLTRALEWERRDHNASLRFSADGRLVLSAGADPTAHVWELATGRELTRITHGDVVEDVALSADDRYIATVAADQTARLSLLRGADLIPEACARLDRNLGRDEWRQFVGDVPFNQTCPNLPEPNGAR